MRTTLLSMTLLGAAVACGEDTADAGNAGATISVVASFYPLAEAAERVGGDRVTVTNLTPAGTEPHDIELSPGQVDVLEDADLVVYLGDGFQPAVEDVAARRDGATLDLLAVLPLDEATPDPHFWLDPTLLTEAVEHIRRALDDLSPDHAATFAGNAEAYMAALRALDAELQAGFSDCERNQIVTSHTAFHYLAEHYGLHHVPITGLSPESEPSPGRLDELADLIEDEGITTVFHETLVAPDAARTLAREAGVETGVLNPIEGLTNQELDAGQDYESLMRENLTALQEALGCR